MLLGEQLGDAPFELGDRWSDVELTITTKDAEYGLDLAFVMDSTCWWKFHGHTSPA